MSESEALTPAQQEIQGQIDAVRGNATHPANNPGHRLHAQEHEKFLDLYRRLHGAPAPAAEQPVPVEDAPPAPRPNVVHEPHATPQTAAELEAVPPPALSPDKVKAGLRWDDGMLRAVNAVAEREGVTGLVLEGRRVVAGAVTGPPVDPVQAERQLQQRWGRAFPSKLEAAHLAFDALPADVRADLERRDLDVHPDVLTYLARVGEKLMDASTPVGERWFREKYKNRTGG